MPFRLCVAAATWELCHYIGRHCACNCNVLDMSGCTRAAGGTAEEQQLRATAKTLQQPWLGTTAGCDGGAAQSGCTLCCIIAPCAAVQSAASAAAASDQDAKQLPKAQRVVRHQAAAEAALQAGVHHVASELRDQDVQIPQPGRSCWTRVVVVVSSATCPCFNTTCCCVLNMYNQSAYDSSRQVRCNECACRRHRQCAK